MIRVELFDTHNELILKPKIEFLGNPDALRCELVQLLFTYIYRFGSEGDVSDNAIDFKVLTREEVLSRLVDVLEQLIDCCSDENFVNLQKEIIISTNVTELSTMLDSLSKDAETG